jgi:hypothetical protein
MKPRGALVLLLLAVSSAFSFFPPISQADAQSPPPITQSGDLHRPAADIGAQIRKWEISADIQVSLIVAVVVFGALISSFHSYTNLWAKRTVLVLGIATSVATGIGSSNAVFSSDYRSLRMAITDANRVITRLDSIAGTPNIASMSPDEFAVVKQQMDAQLDQFDQIVQKVEGSGRAANQSSRNSFPGLIEVPAVQAQSNGDPSWVSKAGSTLSDGRNISFIGTGVDTSLTKAKASSLADAQNQLFAAFEVGAPYVTTDARRVLIQSSAVISDTYFRLDSNNTYSFFTLLTISRNLQRMQPSPAEYKQSGWHPSDLTFNPTAGLLVLDHDGNVSRVTNDPSGIHLQRLFQVPLSSRPAAVAANQESIFVSSNNQVGCVVLQYALATSRTTSRVVATGQGGCDGIATNGTGIFLALPGRDEVRYWPNWGASTFQSFTLPERATNCVLNFDPYGQRLIYGGANGFSYALTPGTGKWTPVSSNLGYINSIATTYNRLLFASGNKVFFFARSNNTGQAPPLSMSSLGGSLTSGVAVDSSNAAWITDYNNSSIRGPFPLY